MVTDGLADADNPMSDVDRTLARAQGDPAAMHTSCTAVLVAGVLGVLASGCSEGTMVAGSAFGDELGEQDDGGDGPTSSSSAATQIDAGEDGEDDDGSAGEAGPGGGEGGSEGDEGGGGETGAMPELPDLDCEPQPPWYYPKPPIATQAHEVRQWRWIPVPEMRCANDTEGGFFANFTESNRDLVVFFGGGGVCYDAISCLLDTPLLLGMGPVPLLTWQADLQSHSGIFDRNDPSNPYRDANFTFFPHCTGDGHTADKISNYGADIHQVGYRNVQEAMRILGPTFETVERITVAGFSAGGIGSLANYHQIAWLFECLGHPAPLLIDDAGPVLRKPFLSELSQASLRTGWGLDDTFADLCPACSTEGYHLALQRIRELHPGARTSLVNAYGDGVVRQLYSALSLDLSFANDPNALRVGLLDYAGWTSTLPDPTPSTRHREFFYWGERHGALVVAPLSDTPGLAQFLQAQLDDAPTWGSVIP